MDVIFLLIAFFFIHEIATVLLTFTSLDRETAKFQSLSALTGTGFSAPDSEVILENRQRRKIISALIIIGRAGIVLLIVAVFHQYQSPFILLKLTALFFVFYLFFRFVDRHAASHAIAKGVDAYFVKGGWIKKRNLEEILHLDQGYGIVELHIHARSSFIGLKLSETGLRHIDVLILSIERHGKVFPMPNPFNLIEENDVLTCYAKLDLIRKMCKDVKQVSVTEKTEKQDNPLTESIS